MSCIHRYRRAPINRCSHDWKRYMPKNIFLLRQKKRWWCGPSSSLLHSAKVDTLYSHHQSCLTSTYFDGRRTPAANHDTNANIRSSRPDYLLIQETTDSSSSLLDPWRRNKRLFAVLSCWKRFTQRFKQSVRFTTKSCFIICAVSNHSTLFFQVVVLVLCIWLPSTINFILTVPSFRAIIAAAQTIECQFHHRNLNTKL